MSIVKMHKEFAPKIVEIGYFAEKPVAANVGDRLKKSPALPSAEAGSAGKTGFTLTINYFSCSGSHPLSPIHNAPPSVLVYGFKIYYKYSI